MLLFSSFLGGTSIFISYSLMIMRPSPPFLSSGGPSNKGTNIRKSSDNAGFEEATFVTSPFQSEEGSRQQQIQSPLHAPRFPVPPPAATTTVSRTNKPNASKITSLPPSPHTVVDLSSSPTTAQGQRQEAAARAGVSTMTPPAVDNDQWYQDQIDYVRTQVEQMENMEIQRGREAKSIRSKWKRELFLMFEDPSSSPSAFIINLFVTFMIIFSAVLTTIETIPSLRKNNSHIWFALELAIVALFTLEFILRFLGHTDTWRQAWNHVKSVITIVDALAIFPFYIELILHRDTSYEFRFTILRIFRLLRVFSAFKYSSLLQLSIEVMIVAIKRSADALLAFLLFVTLTVLLFSTLMYFAERGTWDEEKQEFLTSEGEKSKFSSIPAAAFYSIVTLTTTGFGDMVPVTFIGKLVSFPMMISGILLIALPSIIVGRNFTQVWEAARKYRVQLPNVRTQRIGDTVIDEQVDGGDNDDHSSSLRSRRRRLRKRRYRARGDTNSSNGNRRDGSISSFETPSTRPLSARSPREMAGGYTHIKTGRNGNGCDDEDGDHHGRSDPIDALARKDSFEMQEFASSRHSEIDEQHRADGYEQIQVPISSESEDPDYHNKSSDDEHLAAEKPWKMRKQRLRKSKGKEAETDESLYISRNEWNGLHSELAELRQAVATSTELLQGLSEHLNSKK